MIPPDSASELGTESQSQDHQPRVFCSVVFLVLAALPSRIEEEEDEAPYS